MLPFAIIVLLSGNQYFLKPKEIEMPKVYWERTK